MHIQYTDVVLAIMLKVFACVFSYGPLIWSIFKKEKYVHTCVRKFLQKVI